MRVRGLLEQDKKHGEQLRVESLIELAPDTLAGLEKYLASGLIKGVGSQARAAHRRDLRSRHAPRARRRRPTAFARSRAWATSAATALARAWREQRALRDVMVFLQAHGASPALAARIVRRYGPNAINIVSREPYRLALDVCGVGFKTADRIAATIGVLPDSPERMQAGVLQVLHDLDGGGSRLDRAERGHALAARNARARRATTRTCARASLGAVDACVLDGARRRSSRRAASAPSSPRRCTRPRCASRSRLAELAAARPRALLGGVADAIAALRVAARASSSRPSSGAPSRRRRAAGARRHRRARRRQDDHRPRDPRASSRAPSVVVRLAAPTGRAAKRMSEATGARGDDAAPPARVRPEDGAPSSATAAAPIEAGAIVVDEASMLDLPIADALPQAIAPGTRLILVGDVDQLPSVGPGAVLRDVIASRRGPVRAPHARSSARPRGASSSRTRTASTTASCP